MQILAKHYNDNKFIASKRWVNGFKEGHGIRKLKDSGVQLSSNPTEVQPSTKKKKIYGKN